MKTLKDLFEHQLKGLYSAECKLVEALPKMLHHAANIRLRIAFESHLNETKKHKDRLEKICEELDIQPKEKTYKPRTF
ncbi:uncharacterized protein DUF892 [Mariniflexile fucanivorans]|uniref:Uncharacterized protein DUF892 n=1 Tax=Mariniflexile fucanivorans TaxID=264023 RepID=A0A4R1RPP7_9FLAO|nr:DUF892 family protein [Mariniflexile fucanivorans]TCL67862.1 uncharacterized protein DUF892 [Mariniflexile fucanivorans]